MLKAKFLEGKEVTRTIIYIWHENQNIFTKVRAHAGTQMDRNDEHFSTMLESVKKSTCTVIFISFY